MKKSIFLDVILSTENQPPFQNMSPPFACYLLQFFYYTALHPRTIICIFVINLSTTHAKVTAISQ